MWNNKFIKICVMWLEKIEHVFKKETIIKNLVYLKI